MRVSEREKERDEFCIFVSLSLNTDEDGREEKKSQNTITNFG